MTNGEFANKMEDLGEAAVVLWRECPEELKQQIAALVPTFSELASELNEYV